MEAVYSSLHSGTANTQQFLLLSASSTLWEEDSVIIALHKVLLSISLETRELVKLKNAPQRCAVVGGLCLFVLRFYGPVNPMGSCQRGQFT